MTGPISSAPIAAASPGKVAAPSLMALGASTDGVAGQPSLARFIDVMIGKAEITTKGSLSGDGRQDDAATGNPLPEKHDDKDDLALAWLCSMAPIMLPVADGAAAPMPERSASVAPIAQPAMPPPLPVTDRQQQPFAVVDGAAPPPQPATPAAIPNSDRMTAAAADVLADVMTAMPASTPVIAAEAHVLDAPAPAQRTVRMAVPPIGVAVPAVAPAILAAPASAYTPLPALFALARTPDRDTAGDADTGLSDGIAAAAALLAPSTAAGLIAGPGKAQRQALDMGYQDWPQKMIDRIEALRDDANANDTSIRLKPDALGRVDVALRAHADGAVSVRFTAEQPATRALIADAAPQLAAAAEARGIRLAGTSVDLAGSGMTGGDRPRPQFELQQNSGNHLGDGGNGIEAVSDGRIA